MAMRLIWLMPLALGACAQQPYYAMATRHVQYRVADHMNPSGSDNCGTPDTFKLCAVRELVWRPPPRIPVYAEQLDDIPGNIPLSDMSVIPLTR